MKNKKVKTPEEKLFRARLGILVSVFLLGMALIFALFVPKPTALPATSSPLSSEVLSSSSTVLRTLGQWNGRLALFVGDNPIPDEVFDVFLASLPEQEQRKLKAGIPVTDDTELARMLEDYTS